MLSDWLSDDGRKAIDKTGGWPRWDVATPRPHNPSRLRLLYEDRSRMVETVGQLHENRCWTIETDQGRGDWTHCRAASAYEALCLLRDRAREWLVERHGRVECELFAGGMSRVRVGPAQNRDEYLGVNFDHALIQAALATEKANKSV